MVKLDVLHLVQNVVDETRTKYSSNTTPRLRDSDFSVFKRRRPPRHTPVPRFQFESPLDEVLGRSPS